jgi:glycosyltransferase involved in cell wall biosynthesis
LAWHALETARGLHAAGHDVLLFCKRNSPLATWSEAAPFPVHRDLDPDNISPAEFVKGWRHLRRTIREFRPDILNPHCPPGHTYLAILRGLDHRSVPLIRTVADPRCPSPNPFNKILHSRYTDGMIFTTQSSVRRYQPFMNMERMTHQVILPGFRADDFAGEVKTGGYRERLGVKPEQLLLGIIARMSPEKGQEVLLEALSLLPAEDRAKLFCVMAGEDSRERGQAELKVIARQFGVEEHTAFFSRLDDVRPLMSELDIGLVTSTRSEAICRAALEYMSFGIPVISSDVNILPEVVRNGENGMVFPNHDARALATALQRLLHDADLRRELGNKGHDMVRRSLSLQSEIENTLTFYERVRTQKRSGVS